MNLSFFTSAAFWWTSKVFRPKSFSLERALISKKKYEKERRSGRDEKEKEKHRVSTWWFFMKDFWYIIKKWWLPRRRLRTLVIKYKNEFFSCCAHSHEQSQRIMKSLCFYWCAGRENENVNEFFSSNTKKNFQVAQANFHSPGPNPNYSPVVSKQPFKAQQQQRPVSIHGFSSLQEHAPSQPLSPLPLLQTTSPQIQNPSSRSPRGWAHVPFTSPRSPGAAYQQPKTFYNNAPIASPPFELSNSTSSFGQSQVRSWVSLAVKIPFVSNCLRLALI